MKCNISVCPKWHHQAFFFTVYPYGRQKHEVIDAKRSLTLSWVKRRGSDPVFGQIWIQGSVPRTKGDYLFNGMNILDRGRTAKKLFLGLPLIPCN